MPIECVNTIEIRVVEPSQPAFAAIAKTCLAPLRRAPGCLDYVLSPSTQEPGLWWLSGYWESEQLMTESFDSAPMAHLLNGLIEAGASLSFGSFVSQGEPA
ncbi:antibiotic biosynthesis monooxygenase [Pseudomonas sp. 3A(2025)]